MSQKVAVSREFQAGDWISLCLSSRKWYKAAKGEGWAPSFISCAQDTVGL